MTEILFSIVGFIILILVLVTVHELGHYVVARLAKVVVLRFSIGFGKALWSWTDKRGTQFQICWIPLGGYVQMVDENDQEVPDSLRPYAFNNKSPSWRIAIALAGPAANLLLAFVIFCFIYSGGVSVRPAYVDHVWENSSAAEVGLPAGSTITKINGVDIEDSFEATNELLRYVNEDTILVIETDQGAYDLHVATWVEENGTPLLAESLGFNLGAAPVIKDTLPGSRADDAGFQPGDNIIGIEGVRVTSYRDVSERIRQRPDQTTRFLVKRGDDEVGITVVPAIQFNDQGDEIGFIGVEFDSGERIVHYSPISVIPKAAEVTWRYTTQTIELMGKLVTGKMGTESLAGPIGIAQIAGETLAMQFEVFLMILALISIFLALANLLPLPILDGGHILYAVIETVIRKPVSKRVRLIGNQVSLVMVFTLMVFVFYNDIARIMSN